MRKISIVLTEPEAAALEELARRAGISVEEAAAKAVRFVVKEVTDWALRRARQSANGGEERWCVAMPSRIERQFRRFFGTALARTIALHLHWRFDGRDEAPSL
jgi:hypothetical protein